MNETFRIDDDEEQVEELKPNEVNLKLLGIEESQRRQSILLIENNFKSIQMNADKHRNKSSNNMDDFLENELLPDEYLLDDYMPEAANATLQQQQQHNSILDVDELNLFADHSPSISNLNWLNSKIDDEKSNFTRKLSRPVVDFKAECRLVLNELLDAVSHKCANESTSTSTGPGLYLFLLFCFFYIGC